MGLFRYYGLGSGSGLVGGTVSDGRPSVITAPAATGTTTVGSLLSTTNGTWGGSPVSYAYQWLRGGVTIGGATSSTYTLVTADFGANISCNVVAINGGGGSKSATSNILGPITNPAGIPVISVAPTITGGTPMVGQVLLATNGTWTNSPTGYTYQWKRDGSNIGGATSNGYTVVSGDVGTTITVAVVASNLYGSSSASTSAGAGPVVAGLPANSVAPAISGSAIEGSLLSCTTGTWTNSPTSYTYQWKRGGTNIGGATSSTYTLVTADVGANITCAVVGVNIGGSGSAATSNSVGPIASLGVPTFTRTGTTGASPFTGDVTLTASTGQYIYYEFAAHGTSQNADGTFTSTTQSDVVQISGEAFALNDFTFGFTQPNGNFDFHFQVLADNEFGSTSRTDKLGQTINYDAVTGFCTTYNETITTVTTTLDPTQKSTLATLSNGNLTIAGEGSQAECARTTNQIADGAKLYCEMIIDVKNANAFSSCMLGLTDNTFTFSSGSSSPPVLGKGAGLAQNANVYPSPNDISPIGVGDRIGCVIKRSGLNCTVWISKNNVYTGDPSAETGGKTYTLPNANAYGFAGACSNGINTATVNFGLTAFTYTKPTGSTVWP